MNIRLIRAALILLPLSVLLALYVAVFVASVLGYRLQIIPPTPEATPVIITF